MSPPWWSHLRKKCYLKSKDFIYVNLFYYCTLRKQLTLSRPSAWREQLLSFFDLWAFRSFKHILTKCVLKSKMPVTCQSFLADRGLSLSDTSSWGGGKQTLTEPFSSLKQSCQLAVADPAMGGFGRQQGELWLLKNRLK